MSYSDQFIIEPAISHAEMFSVDGDSLSFFQDATRPDQQIKLFLSKLSDLTNFDYAVFQMQFEPMILSYIKNEDEINQVALYLGELLLEFGAGEKQTSLFQLMPMEQIVDSVLEYLQSYVGNEPEQIGSQVILKKISSSYRYCNYFKNYAMLWISLQSKQKDLEALDADVKSLELKIRDLNKKIKNTKLISFTVNGKPQDYSQFGEIEEIYKKIKDVKIKLGFEDEGSEKYQKYLSIIAMLEKDVEINTNNEAVMADKDMMKENVKKWGLEAKEKKERLKDLRDEVNVSALIANRNKKVKEFRAEGALAKAFSEKLNKIIEGDEGVGGFNDEMISVGAAVRLAEAMKSQMVMPNMGPAPVVNVTNVGGGASNGGQSGEDMSYANKPLKPDFDYTNRDKDTLIQLIYDCDEKGFRFEKSAETLEALVYKSPSKAAQIMIDQGVRNQVFYLR